MSGLSAQEEEFAGPCPRDGYYDVFISFRGIDTRSGFTDTLYHSLLGSKIYTFIDADLAGNVIETLFEIIGRSRMAVVVYSERFASSHWCLTELEMIMQRWEEKKMLMIPIFYKVSVNELKYPTEKTIKYFDEHIQKYDKTVVEKWKNAVTKIGIVSGFPYKDVYSRSERDFIVTQVIVTIKKKLREWREIVQKSSISKPINNNSGSVTENHDVFISFLGKDAHYDLVSHLNEALKNYRKELKIFMVDRDLLKDDTIFEVIQRSKIAVIVFSPNYASSKWCLRELVEILQCCNTGGQEIMSIFYEITQQDLINQEVKGRIAYHLKKHARNEESETIQSWRDAIIDLGNTVGWRYSTTHNHSKAEELAQFIQKLVEEIMAMLNRIEDETKKSTKIQQAHELSAKEEDTQALAVIQTDMNAASKMVEKLELSSNHQQQTDEAVKEFAITLNHSNFSETTNMHEFVVVLFYDPRYDFCKKVDSEYEKAASILSRTHPRVILAKVDTGEEANRYIVDKHSIHGVPNIKILRDRGETICDYKNGGIAAESIAEYLKKQSGPTSTEITSAEDTSGLIRENSVVIVGVFPKFSGEEYDNFIDIAKILRSRYDFAHTQDAKLLPRGDSSVSGPLVRILKSFDELFVDSEDFNVEALNKFIEESSLPLLTLFTNDRHYDSNTVRFYSRENAKVILIMNFTDEAAKSMKEKYYEVAKKFKGDGFIFLLGDLESSGEILEDFKFKEEQVPIIVGVYNGRNYIKANIKVDDIAPWMQDHKDGNLVPNWVLLAPKPAKK